ncbi:DUF2829 domain-containing protein [Xenorhabdus sp. psl]|nr:DUF2829 domain-containing protein [Xenorhabdus sp. psl]
MGSFPWALLRVYSGKSVTRFGWISKVNYIKLIPRLTHDNGTYTLPQIWICDAYSEQVWTPTQEDLMANDWEQLSESKEYEISFDLTVGSDITKL